MKNLSSWLVIYLVVTFNKIPLVFEDLMNFKISLFHCLLASVMSLGVLNFFTKNIYSRISKNIIRFPLYRFFVYYYFFKIHVISFSWKWINDLIWIRSITRHQNYPKLYHLDSWVFENFMLADESFAKALRIFQICVLVNHNS